MTKTFDGWVHRAATLDKNLTKNVKDCLAELSGEGIPPSVCYAVISTALGACHTRFLNMTLDKKAKERCVDLFKDLLLSDEQELLIKTPVFE